MMKLKLFAIAAAGLGLLPAAAPAQSEGGGVFILSSRTFSGQNTPNYGGLRERYSGSANTEVQAELKLLGYYHGPIDGNVWPGTRTAAAIALYQRDHRLPATGLIDGGLLASLNDALGGH
jgi:peptidoglycan hydrolase-like protein with peptidoglycan-binding domain